MIGVNSIRADLSTTLTGALRRRFGILKFTLRIIGLVKFLPEMQVWCLEISERNL